MAGFVKLDSGILESTLWGKKDARDLFITALLMAIPHEVTEPMEAMNITDMKPLGFTVPPGWYGFVAAAGVGIVRRCGLEHERGMRALEELASPEPDSRSPDYEGRRMVRVDGGFIVLNFVKYRDKDHTAGERMRRWRARNAASRPERDVTRIVTQAEVRGQRSEADSEVQKKTPRAGALGSSNKPPKLIEAAKPAEVPQGMWDEWRALRGPKKLVTERVLNGIEREAGKAGMSVTDALAYTLESSWLSFKAAWYEKAMRSGGATKRRVADGGDWTGNSEPIQEI